MFILCAEILSIKLKNNKNIRDIKDNEILISQFADDTSLILDDTELSLHSALDELTYFATLSGLKINFFKTQVIWIGSKKHSKRNSVSGGKIRFG